LAKGNKTTMTVLTDQQNWNKQYENLVEFKRKNGHCLVPQKYRKDGLALGTWVRTQRGLHSNNKLRRYRKAPLDEIGFIWKVPASGGNYDKIWHTQYEKLVEFKRKNGHCIVPQRYQEVVGLGIWVDRQRQSHCKNKLRVDRKVLLDEIGFVWRVKRPSTCLAESEQITATTIPIGGAIGSPSSVEKKDGGRHDEDSEPSPPSSPDQEVVVPEEAKTLGKLPSGWKHVKLEPDC
jgi:hypothetical protein